MRIIIKTILILIASTFIFGCGFNTIYTRYNAEIDQNLRASMKKHSLVLIEGIKSSDDKIYKDLALDPKLLSSLNSLFSIERFDLFDEYYSTFNSLGAVQQITIPTDEEQRLYIKQIQSPGKQSYAQFWKSNNTGIQHLLFLYYGKQNEEWKLLNIHVGDYAIDNQNAPELINKSKFLLEEKKYFAAVMYSLAAKRVLQPAPHLLYKNEDNYKNTIVKVEEQFKKYYSSPIFLDSSNKVQVFSINLAVTKEGMVPIIEYITPTDIENHDQVVKEAEILYPKVKEVYLDAQSSFKYILLKAYNEIPSEPDKNYNAYGTVFKDGRRLEVK